MENINTLPILSLAERLKLIRSRFACDPDLDDGLEYMQDPPMTRNTYAELYLGEEWKD